MRVFKIVVLGSGGVGKSALTVKYVSDNFEERYDPTIEDFYIKEINLDGSNFILEILDTAGIEQFTNMRDLYIRNGEYFVLVFSLINKATLDSLDAIIERIVNIKSMAEEEAEEKKRQDRARTYMFDIIERFRYCRNQRSKIPLIIVGNKCDLVDQRQVTIEEARKIADKWSCRYYEASARSGENVAIIFEEAVRQILTRDRFSRRKSLLCCR